MSWKGDKFEFKEFDWEAYQSFRPPYPQSLYKLVYDYHEQGDSGWDNALDVGSGLGIVAAELTNRFGLVTASDINASYLEEARQRLNKLLGCDAGKVEYLEASAEDLSMIASSSVNIVTIAMTIHWTDHAKVMPQILRILKPGGTCMIHVYSTRAIFPDAKDVVANEALDRIFDHWWEYMGVLLPRNPRPAAIAASDLNCIHFNSLEWRHVHRYRWFPERDMIPPSSSIKPETDQSGKEDKRFVHPNEGMLTHAVDFEWVVKYFDMLLPQEDFIAHMKQAPWSDLRAAMAGQRLKIAWPAVLILARKI